MHIVHLKLPAGSGKIVSLIVKYIATRKNMRNLHSTEYVSVVLAAMHRPQLYIAATIAGLMCTSKVPRNEFDTLLNISLLCRGGNVPLI